MFSIDLCVCVYIFVCMWDKYTKNPDIIIVWVVWNTQWYYCSVFSVQDRCKSGVSQKQFFLPHFNLLGIFLHELPLQNVMNIKFTINDLKNFCVLIIIKEIEKLFSYEGGTEKVSDWPSFQNLDQMTKYHFFFLKGFERFLG